TWKFKESGTKDYLYDVSFTDKNNATAVGLGGTILRTTDGGSNWFIQNNIKPEKLKGVCFTDNYNGTIVSSSGSIIRTFNGGYVKVESDFKSPIDFSLVQNYPNPFNPITTISYSIPKESYVVLKVYDLLGREMSTLVNKGQSAGEYKVNFDGSSLPSGIYIYTIHTGQYRASKKLMLLK
ncbi:MAG: T9SS type A sorting domain-containing protein, partial [Bacteroidota bacterium]|nr:T9SS type A sorting domain-containing protein [Bacteroidota bacterium]